MKIFITMLVLIITAMGIAYADTDSPGQSGNNAGKQNFAGINLGLGLALTFRHGEDRIEDASVENGIVRVSKEKNVDTKIMLETHYFFKPEWEWLEKLKEKIDLPKENFGIGPFIAIEPDSSGGQVIGAYSLGIMTGFKRDTGNASWNIGVGYGVNTGVKVLGDGIEEGKPLPEGEKGVRYKEINQPGWMIITSFSW